jgi:glycosyltransferase involved in cell wall biosynthesis
LKILKDKRILIISPEPWNFISLSKHRFAIALARLGNAVFFLNPPGDRSVCEPVDKHKNLFVIDYQSAVRGLNHFPTFLTTFIWKKEARKIERIAGGEFDIIWSFDPYRFQQTLVFQTTYSIYYSADVHRDKKLENRIAGTADLVLSPSSTILDSIPEGKNRRLKVTHGVDDEFFKTPRPHFSMPGKNSAKAGFSGNLLIEFLDRELLLDVVSMFPDVDFVFAGNGPENQNDFLQRLSSLENVFLVGRLSGEEFVAFLNSCTLLLLTYVPTLNSHKILEYLSTGKPIVSTPIEEYQTMSEDDHLILFAKTREEFLHFMREIVTEGKYTDPRLQNRRRAFAESKKYSSILKIIDNTLEELDMGQRGKKITSLALSYIA